ncbi:MAG: TolC family protein [Acidobacteriia bacterium]|nr:TolC family protein [Terriglobia bacterium]
MRDTATYLVITVCCWFAAVPAPGQGNEARGTRTGDNREAALTSAPAPSRGRATASLDFWRGLGDAKLAGLMDEMLRANLDVRAAEARLEEARASRREAALELAPTGEVSGSYTRQRLSPASFPNGSGSFPDQNIWDVGFDASWEFDLFGRLRRGLEAQEATVAANVAGLEDVQVSLAAELARAYFELRGAQDQLAVARHNTENQQRTLDLTRQRLDAGRGTAFDTDRAVAQLSFTQASIPTLEARVAAAQYRIGVLVGRPPLSVVEELKEPAPMPATPAIPAAGSTEELIGRRPDVTAAEDLLRAQTALLGAAKAELRPRVSVGASAGYTATALDALGERGTFRYFVGPTISWPVIGLGRVKAGVAAARAREAEVRAGYEQTVLRAREEVEAALARYSAARTRVERIGDAATSSKRAADLALLRFSDGLGDLLDVLDAERTQLEAENQLALARTEAATTCAALYKALGGAWPAPQGGAGQ